MTSQDPGSTGEERSTAPHGLGGDPPAVSEGGGSKRVWRGVGLAAALLALVVAVRFVGGGAADPGEASSNSPEAGNDTTEAVNLAPLGHDLGVEEDASIYVVEFSDFGCVHCQRFHQQTFPTLREEYVETGRVAWKYIPVTIGGFPNAQEVTEAAECAAEQGAFFDVSGRLYEDPDAWSRADDPYEVVTEWAGEEGLDVDDFQACIEEGEVRHRVQEYTETARELGLRATPTFVVNGQPVEGAPPLEAFQEFFETQLEGAPEPPDG